MSAAHQYKNLLFGSAFLLYLHFPCKIDYILSIFVSWLLTAGQFMGIWLKYLNRRSKLDIFNSSQKIAQIVPYTVSNMDLRFRNWTYIQTSLRLKNNHATTSSQARCVCRIFVNQISISCRNNNEQIRYLFLSIYSLSIKKVFSFGHYFKFLIASM